MKIQDDNYDDSENATSTVIIVSMSTRCGASSGCNEEMVTRCGV